MHMFLFHQKQKIYIFSIFSTIRHLVFYDIPIMFGILLFFYLQTVSGLNHLQCFLLK